MDDSVIGILVRSVLFFAAMVGIVPAVIAAQRGRNFALWWAFGTVLIPVALPMAFLLRQRRSLKS